MAPEGLVIRPFHPDDTAGQYEIVSHPVVARKLVHLPSMEFSETLAWAQSQQPGRHRMVADAGGKVVGADTLTQAQNPRMAHSAGLGMMVHPDFWGQGIGSRLMETVLDLADNWLNLKRVELEVNVDNPAGIRLYEKFGFVVEGTKQMHVYGDGRWADSHFMARIKE